MNKKIINIALSFVAVGLVLKLTYQPDASSQALSTNTAHSEQSASQTRSNDAQSEPDIRADLNSTQLTAGEQEKIRQVVERFAASLPRLVGTDPQAQLVYNYYQQEAMFGRPRMESMIAGRTVPNGRTAGTLRIVIMSREEAARVGDPNAQISTFRYRADVGAVIMDPTMMSEPWEEQSFLHELWHAYVDRVLHQASANDEQIGSHRFAIAEEADAHHLGYRLLNHWTNGRYEQVLDMRARWHLDHAPNELQGLTRNDARALDQLFPPCASSERGIRDPQYEIDLAVALARVRGQDQNDARMQVLRRLYSEVYGR